MRIPFLRSAAVLLAASGMTANAAKAGDYLNPPASGPVVVTRDIGGTLSDYVTQTAAYRAAGREVRIKGVCNSACTTALGAGNVCVYPSARMGFHQAYYSPTGGIVPIKERVVVPEASQQLFGYYPVSVKARLGELTKATRVLSGSQLIGLGVPNCLAKGGGRVTHARL